MTRTTWKQCQRFVLTLTFVVMLWLGNERKASSQVRRRENIERKVAFDNTMFQTLVLSLKKSMMTEITSDNSILDFGFPSKWNPCTIWDLIHRKNESTLRISVVGGSSTAHSARQCSLTEGNQDGRYSDILQSDLNQELRNASIQFDLINVGHGDTDSLWNAIVMDELINTSNTDILIWEYGTNDALGGSTGYPARTHRELKEVLNLWLWRVAQLFSPLTPPPILLLFLWDASFHPFEEFHSIGQTAIRSQMQVIKHYRNQGWSIEALNVGGVVNATNLSKNFTLLLDDYHHPSCGGMKLISTMIRQALYSNLASCSSSIEKYTNERTQNDLTPMYAQGNSRLKKVLLANTVVGSKMEWQPQMGASLLRIIQGSNMTIESSAGSKSVSWRKDRKFSWVLPICPERIEFTIFEPELEYLGIGYGGGILLSHGYQGKVEVIVNGVLINASFTQDPDDILISDRKHFFSIWIYMPTNLPHHDEYSLSFCKKVSIESRCIFLDAASLDEVCTIWMKSKNQSSCPQIYAKASSIGEACMTYYNSPEGLALAAKYGKWDGDWGKGDPQINWIIGVKR
jgi:hypothetical protein